MLQKICSVDGCAEKVHCKDLCNKHYRRLNQEKRDTSDLPNEVWKDIEGFEDIYKISNMGRVKALERDIQHKKGPHFNQVYHFRERIMTPTLRGEGYLGVSLSKNNHITAVLIHRLVAKAFIPNPNGLPEVNHIDGDKTNNSVDNLEWCSRKDNARHSYYKLLQKKGCFTAHPVVDKLSGTNYASITLAQRSTGIDRHKILEDIRKGEHSNRWLGTC